MYCWEKKITKIPLAQISTADFNKNKQTKNCLFEIEIWSYPAACVLGPVAAAAAAQLTNAPVAESLAAVEGKHTALADE